MANYVFHVGFEWVFSNVRLPCGKYIYLFKAEAGNIFSLLWVLARISSDSHGIILKFWFFELQLASAKDRVLWSIAECLRLQKLLPDAKRVIMPERLISLFLLL